MKRLPPGLKNEPGAEVPQTFPAVPQMATWGSNSESIPVIEMSNFIVEIIMFTAEYKTRFWSLNLIFLFIKTLQEMEYLYNLSYIKA